MSLRERQEEQLHLAVLLYLQKRFPETAKVFQEEAHLQNASPTGSGGGPTAGGSTAGRPLLSSTGGGGGISLSSSPLEIDGDLLPRRWGATARLQAKVTTLQNQIQQKDNQLAVLMAASAGRTASSEGDLAGPGGGGGLRKAGTSVHAGGGGGETTSEGGRVGGEAFVLPIAPAVYTLAGQQRLPVNALAVHPFISQLVTAADDGVLRFFHIMRSEGKFERQLKAHTAAINDVVFDASGRWLASASSDLGVRVYDVQQNYEPVRTLQGHEDIVSSIKFCTLGGPSPGDSSPSSVLHASGGLFNRQSSNGVPSGLGASATSSAPSSDSQQLYSPLSSLFLVSCSRDGTVKLWNVGAGLCLRTFSSASAGETLGGVGGTREGWIRSVSVPDEDLKAAKVLASCGNDQKVCLWRYDFGVTVREMAGHSHVVEDVVFASAKMLRLLHAHKQAPAPLPSGLLDEALLREKEKASGGDPHVLRQAGLVLFSSSRDRTLRMWDATQGTTMKVFVGHDNWVRRVILHPAGRHIISCSDDRSVRCWNVISGACERVLSSAHTQFVTCLGFDCTSYLLATGSLDRSVKLWSCSRSQQAELTDDSTAGLNHHKAPTAATTTRAGGGDA